MLRKLANPFFLPNELRSPQILEWYFIFQLELFTLLTKGKISQIIDIVFTITFKFVVHYLLSFNLIHFSHFLRVQNFLYLKKNTLWRSFQNSFN